MKLTQCFRCHEKIWWGVTAEGAKIPVNSWRPKGGGGNVLVLDPEADTPLVLMLKKGETAEGPRYLSHFSTCKAKRRSR